METYDHAAAIMDALPPARRHLLQWLIDLLADVVQHNADNDMSARKLSIVVTPNLHRTEKEDPAKLMILSRKFPRLVELLIETRARELFGVEPVEAEPVAAIPIAAE